jgi:hypothetical protein
MFVTLPIYNFPLSPSLLNYPSIDKKASLVYKSIKSIDNVPARLITYNGESDKGTELKFEVYFVIKSSKAYQIMFITEAEDDFNLQDQVLHSIAIKPMKIVTRSR